MSDAAIEDAPAKQLPQFYLEIHYDHEQPGADGQLYKLQPDEFIAPDSPDAPGVLRKGSEVRIENSELQRKPVVIPAGFAVLYTARVANKHTPGPGEKQIASGTLLTEVDRVEWPFIQPGCVEILFATKELRKRDTSYRRKHWDAYVTGSQQKWPAIVPHPKADPTRAPDIGDPGAAGTDRARMAVPGMTRFAALMPTQTRLWSPFLTSLRAALRDHGRRAFHYRVNGKPWRADEHGGVVGNYRSPGGITGEFAGIKREDRGGQWCVDPMHATVSAYLTLAVEDRSEMAWLDAMECCQALDSHLRTKANGPVRPLRYYALPLYCVAQAGLVAAGYRPNDLPVLFDMFTRFVTLIETHIEESEQWLTPKQKETMPTVPLRNELRGDHMDVTEHVAEWLRDFPGNDGLTDEELRKKARDEHWFDWFAFWMLGQMAHAVAASIAFCEAVSEAGNPAAFDMLKRCKQLGRRTAEMAWRFCLVKNNPTPARALEEGQLPQPGWLGAFYKDNAPIANVVRVAESDSKRGVFTTFGASGFAELQRYVSQEKCRAIVDAHLDSLNNHPNGWGNRDPDREAAGAYFHALEWRTLTDPAG